MRLKILSILKGELATIKRLCRIKNVQTNKKIKSPKVKLWYVRTTNKEALEISPSINK